MNNSLTLANNKNKEKLIISFSGIFLFFINVVIIILCFIVQNNFENKFIDLNVEPSTSEIYFYKNYYGKTESENYRGMPINDKIANSSDIFIVLLYNKKVYSEPIISFLKTLTKLEQKYKINYFLLNQLSNVYFLNNYKINEYNPNSDYLPTYFVFNKKNDLDQNVAKLLYSSYGYRSYEELYTEIINMKEQGMPINNLYNNYCDDTVSISVLNISPLEDNDKNFSITFEIENNSNLDIYRGYKNFGIKEYGTNNIVYADKIEDVCISSNNKKEINLCFNTYFNYYNMQICYFDEIISSQEQPKWTWTYKLWNNNN